MSGNWWHADAQGGGRWSLLSFGSPSVFTNGAFARVTLVFDYQSNAGVAYGQVRVDGSCGVLWDKAGDHASADGVHSPKNPTANGSWFRLFAVPADAKKLSALQTRGATQLDDVVFSCHEPSVAPAFDMGTVTGVNYTGQKVSGWIPFSTFDDVWGLPRDPSCDSDGDGFSNGEEILRGTDPLDPASHPNKGFVILYALADGG